MSSAASGRCFPDVQSGLEVARPRLAGEKDPCQFTLNEGGHDPLDEPRVALVTSAVRMREDVTSEAGHLKIHAGPIVCCLHGETTWRMMFESFGREVWPQGHGQIMQGYAQPR